MAADDKAWDEAVVLARASANLEEPIIDVVRYARVPFLVALHTKFGGAYVLVHRGAVFAERGLEAMARFLRESGALERKNLDVSDLTTLIEVLAALPARGDQDPPPLYLTDGPEALAPAIAWDGGGLRMTVYYWPQAGEDGGAPIDESISEVEEWQLAIDSQRAEWTHTVRRFDTDAGTFVK